MYFLLALAQYFFLQSFKNQGEKPLQNRITPPILMSRIMTFVFASMAVLLGVMGYTLYKMFPLNRPQVFFLTTTPRNDMTVKLMEMPVNDDNFDLYKRAFIREYIKARNEIVSNPKVMRMKWGNQDGGYVRIWSTKDVYDDFKETGMWRAIMSDMPGFDFKCPVEFETGAVQKRTDNTYTVRFKYFCEGNNEQLTRKDYTIIIGLETDDNAAIKWTERLGNPLGLRVSEYRIESGNGDPLDTGYLE